MQHLSRQRLLEQEGRPDGLQMQSMQTEAGSGQVPQAYPSGRHPIQNSSNLYGVHGLDWTARVAVQPEFLEAGLDKYVGSTYGSSYHCGQSNLKHTDRVGSSALEEFVDFYDCIDINKVYHES